MNNIWKGVKLKMKKETEAVEILEEVDFTKVQEIEEVVTPLMGTVDCCHNS